YPGAGEWACRSVRSVRGRRRWAVEEWAHQRATSARRAPREESPAQEGAEPAERVRRRIRDDRPDAAREKEEETEPAARAAGRIACRWSGSAGGARREPAAPRGRPVPRGRRRQARRR